MLGRNLFLVEEAVADVPRHHATLDLGALGVDLDDLAALDAAAASIEPHRIAHADRRLRQVVTTHTSSVHDALDVVPVAHCVDGVKDVLDLHLCLLVALPYAYVIAQGVGNGQPSSW